MLHHDDFHTTMNEERSFVTHSNVFKLILQLFKCTFSLLYSLISCSTWKVTDINSMLRKNKTNAYKKNPIWIWMEMRAVLIYVSDGKKTKKRNWNEHISKCKCWYIAVITDIWLKSKEPVIFLFEFSWTSVRTHIYSLDKFFVIFVNSFFSHSKWEVE